MNSRQSRERQEFLGPSLIYFAAEYTIKNPLLRRTEGSYGKESVKKSDPDSPEHRPPKTNYNLNWYTNGERVG